MLNNNFGNLDPNQQNNDKKNLVIFMIIVFALFAVYDIFVKQPYVDAMKAKQAQEAEANPQPAIAKETVQNKVLDREQALGLSPRVKIESDKVAGSISLRGGRIDDLKLHGYYETIEKEEDVHLLMPKETGAAQYGEFGWVSVDPTVKLPNAQTLWQVQGNRTLTPQAPVTMTWNNGQGLVFKRVISLDEHYMFAVKQSVTNNSGKDVTLYPFSVIAQKGERIDGRKLFILHNGPIGFMDGELEEVDYKEARKKRMIEKASEEGGWIGITQKYWFTGLVPSQEGNSKFRFIAQPSPNGAVNYQTDVMGPQVTIMPKGTSEYTSHLFAGPKLVRLLDQYEETLNVPHFDLVVDFGMFYFLTKPFFYALTWISHTIGSFAIGLLIFTVLLRLLVFPLAQKSYRSFAKMRVIAPKMKELQEKYKDDREGMQKALFELYKKEDVNPAAGCLPMLIQIPIFFALYKVLYITIEMRHTPFFGWVQDMAAPDHTTIFNLFGLIPWDPPSFLMIGAWPCLMLVTLLIQQRLSPPPTDKIQKQVMMTMPFVMTFILSKFPVGLVIYWTWSNCLSVIQQSVLMKSMGVEIHLFSFMKSKKEKETDEILEHAPQTFETLEHEVEEQFDDEDETPKDITPPKRKRKKK